MYRSKQVLEVEYTCSIPPRTIQRKANTTTSSLESRVVYVARVYLPGELGTLKLQGLTVNRL
jgi:hypothetical protein